MKIRHLKNQNGFTIIELMIATMVFSVVLMICTYGLLNISRTYTKGITTNRTQEVARSIINDISDNIRFSGGKFSQLSTLPNGSSGFCLGSTKYSFITDHQLISSSPDTATQESSQVMRAEAECNGASEPRDMRGSMGGREMLGERMQLANLEVCGLNHSGDCQAGPSGLYKITIRVVSGTDDLFEDNNIEKNCATGRAGGQFCAVSELTTVVKKKVQ